MSESTLYSLDIETTGLSSFSDKLLCIGVYNPQSGYGYFPTVESFLAWHKPSNQYICHNGRFDINFLRRLGCDLFHNFNYDTRSIATILVPWPGLAAGQRHLFSLENLHIKLLNGARYKLDRTSLDSVDQESLRRYNETDCRVTWDLFEYLVSQLSPKDWEFVESWLMPATKLCTEMEYNGIFIDQALLKNFQTEIEERFHKCRSELAHLTLEARNKWHQLQLEQLETTYAEMAAKAIAKAKDKEKAKQRYRSLCEKAKEKVEPFNFNSSVQLKWLLKDFYGINITNQRSEKETTDEAMLKKHAHRKPVCQAILDYRECEKLLSTCIPALRDNISVDLHVHPSFTIGGTRTGRLSSSSPNCQNLPRGPLRQTIIPSPGYKFFVGDFAQIEVRIMAELAQEEELLNAFKEEIDPYSLIAKKLFRIDCEVRELKARFPKERNTAKTAGLSILYGTGAAKLQEVIKKDLGLDFKLEECRDYIKSYRDGFPSIKAFKAQCEVNATNQAKVYNLLGRPTYIESNEDLYMTALNTLVQGSASDLVVKAACAIWERFPRIRPVMLIHDEMVFEIPEDEVAIAEEMAKIATEDMQAKLSLTVPLKIEYTVCEAWEKP